MVALKNAIDYLYAEWQDKAAGLVGYGIHGGIRATEHMRLILAELKVADVRSVVALSLGTDFASFDAEQLDAFRPPSLHEQALVSVVDEVVAWSQALAPLRKA
jgi:NAD(P)H-dependent FMN reductase